MNHNRNAQDIVKQSKIFSGHFFYNTTNISFVAGILHHFTGWFSNM